MSGTSESVRCLGRRDRAFVIRIVAGMVEKITQTFGNSIWVYSRHGGSDRVEAGIPVQQVYAFCPSLSEDFLRVGNSVLTRPAVNQDRVIMGCCPETLAKRCSRVIHSHTLSWRSLGQKLFCQTSDKWTKFTSVKPSQRIQQQQLR